MKEITVASRNNITHSRLKELLHYNPFTGVFTWLVSPCNSVPAGAVAGGLNGEGYRYIEIDGKAYSAHRLAWFYMTGEWPSDQIDHRHRDTSDNRWKNLRPATHGQNRRNSKPSGVSKFKGVSWHCCGKWRADAYFNGKMRYLGLHTTEESAAAAYATFAAENFPEFARLE